MDQTVVGIFDERDAAEAAVQKLYSTGFSRSEIDITSASIGGDGRKNRDQDDSFGEKVEKFFSNLFTDEEESMKYSTAARNGTVVSVQAHSPEEAVRASRILDDMGAVDGNERAGTAMNKASIPVIEEELQVGKRQVETGGIRVRSRIIEKPVEETLRLREEHVNVERSPANRPATEGDLSTFKDSEIEMKESAEVPVVNKQARVVEEVRLNKDVREREEKVRDTVRRKDVDIEESDKRQVKDKGN